MKTSLYIHDHSSLHTIGICLESEDKELKAKFLEFVYREILNNPICCKTLNPFFQSGHDTPDKILESKYYYIEMWRFYSKLPIEVHDYFLNLVLELSEYLGIPID